jgi:hypothetical protein
MTTHFEDLYNFLEQHFKNDNLTELSSYRSDGFEVYFHENDSSDDKFSFAHVQSRPEGKFWIMSVMIVELIVIDYEYPITEEELYTICDSKNQVLERIEWIRKFNKTTKTET